MIKILTILGARSQFIKAGSVSREIVKHILLLVCIVMVFILVNIDTEVVFGLSLVFSIFYIIQVSKSAKIAKVY